MRYGIAELFCSAVFLYGKERDLIKVTGFTYFDKYLLLISPVAYSRCFA